MPIFLLPPFLCLPAPTHRLSRCFLGLSRSSHPSACKGRWGFISSRNVISGFFPRRNGFLRAKSKASPRPCAYCVFDLVEDLMHWVLWKDTSTGSFFWMLPESHLGAKLAFLSFLVPVRNCENFGFFYFLVFGSSCPNCW